MHAGKGVLSDMYFAHFGRIKERNCWGEDSIVKPYRKEEKWSFLRRLQSACFAAMQKIPVLCV